MKQATVAGCREWLDGRSADHSFRTWTPDLQAIPSNAKHELKMLQCSAASIAASWLLAQPPWILQGSLGRPPVCMPSRHPRAPLPRKHKWASKNAKKHVTKTFINTVWYAHRTIANTTLLVDTFFTTYWTRCWHARLLFWHTVCVWYVWTRSDTLENKRLENIRNVKHTADKKH